ncbi:ribosomal protein L4 domain-containing protein [Mycena galericulata]|nr:ribosomal protein L4 domain-containing protein [Mycena galericulata]
MKNHGTGNSPVHGEPRDSESAVRWRTENPPGVWGTAPTSCGPTVDRGTTSPSSKLTQLQKHVPVQSPEEFTLMGFCRGFDPPRSLARSRSSFPVHKRIAKHKRQAYSDSQKAGHQTSAESWGTGHAVACIPRVGRLRKHALRWTYVRAHQDLAQVQVKVNQNQRRFAVVSVLTTVALLSLALARGHRIEQIEDVPLVIASAAESFTKTNEAVTLLKSLNAYADVIKVSNSRKLRAGKGKMHNRRHRQRRGPLLSTTRTTVSSRRSAISPVSSSPTSGGSTSSSSHAVAISAPLSSGLMRPSGSSTRCSGPGIHIQEGLTSADVQDLQPRRHSADQQRQDPVCCPPAGQKVEKRPWTQKKNPLVNMAMLFRLNPYAKTICKHELRESAYFFAPHNHSHPHRAPEEGREEAQAPHRHEAFTALPKASVDRHTCLYCVTKKYIFQNIDI